MTAPVREAAADWTRLSAPAGSRVAVAGGAGAIGRAVVAAALACGHTVAVLDLPKSLADHPPPQGVSAISLDATDPESVRSAMAALADAWPCIDALVFTVGFTITPPVRLDAIDVAQWDEVIAGNLRSAFLVARAALPLLHQAASPAIVNVASGLVASPIPGFGPYSAAKAGLIALTKALAIELGPRIRANAVAPSAIQTAFMMGGTGRGPEDASAGAWFDPSRFLDSIPLKRMAEVDDVVGPILFLIGPAARFITGQTLHVNGGRTTP